MLSRGGHASPTNARTAPATVDTAAQGGPIQNTGMTCAQARAGDSTPASTATKNPTPATPAAGALAPRKPLKPVDPVFRCCCQLRTPNSTNMAAV